MKSQKGQTLVETALILPILLMLLFGITDFGRILHVYLTLDHAGREGARGATVGSEDDVILLQINNATAGLDENKLQIAITPQGKVNRASGSEVAIKLTYPVDFLTPIIGQVIGSIELENTTVMRVE